MIEIQGSFKVADITVDFVIEEEMARYTVSLYREGHSVSRAFSAPQDKFLKALSIMVHNDGMPDYRADYPEAESIQPKDPDFRWIP